LRQHIGMRPRRRNSPLPGLRDKSEETVTLVKNG
jgi:hypothetical protein